MSIEIQPHSRRGDGGHRKRPNLNALVNRDLVAIGSWKCLETGRRGDLPRDIFKNSFWQAPKVSHGGYLFLFIPTQVFHIGCRAEYGYLGDKMMLAGSLICK